MTNKYMAANNFIEFNALFCDNAYLISKKSRDFWFESCMNSILDKDRNFSDFSVLSENYGLSLIRNDFRLNKEEKKNLSQVFLFRKNSDMEFLLDSLFSLNDENKDERILQDVTLGILLGYDIFDTISYLEKIDCFEGLCNYYLGEEISNESLSDFSHLAWILDFQAFMQMKAKVKVFGIPLFLVSVQIKGKTEIMDIVKNSLYAKASKQGFMAFVGNKDLGPLVSFLFHYHNSSENLHKKKLADFCLFRLFGVNFEAALAATKALF